MSRARKGNIVNGWINLDKPAGLTSTQAMSRVKRFFNAQKAGHAGTLDPLATGVLPVALGEATKTIPFVQDNLKTYSFTVRWGEQRDTDDSEGTVIAASPHRPTAAEIEKLLSKYTGDILQTPPQFSAIKIDGQRAYDLAREGEHVDLKPREVYIQSIKLSPPHPTLSPMERGSRGETGTGEGAPVETTDFTMICSKGTYVRALARDMAADLGTCGYVAALRRLAVGPFSAENAISLDFLAGLDNSAALDRALLPVRTVLDDIPALALREEETARLRNGQALSFVSRPDVDRLEKAGLEIGKTGKTAVAFLKDKPVALIEVQGVNIKPVRVLNI